MIDPVQVTAIIREVAEEVILPRFGHLAEGDVRQKKPGDFVTIADTEAERLLTERLSALLPGSLVVGEEAVAADPTVLDRLSGTDPVWILDPIDGTTNFTQGNKLFAVIVALVVEGRTVQGWIHDPVENRTIWAIRGEGCWCDSQRLRITAEPPLAEMTGSAGWRRQDKLRRRVANLVRQGSAAHDYLGLVDGRLHFALYRRLRPWDHAAGVLLVEEAGGCAALTDGSPYRPVYTEETILLTAGKRSWDEVVGLLG
jgi:fructose-1,6-bisphosphatase/inositol monophosphatase family enzyme